MWCLIGWCLLGSSHTQPQALGCKRLDVVWGSTFTHNFPWILPVRITTIYRPCRPFRTIDQPYLGNLRSPWFLPILEDDPPSTSTGFPRYSAAAASVRTSNVTLRCAGRRSAVVKATARKRTICPGLGKTGEVDPGLRTKGYCWWFRNPVNSPVEVGSWNPIIDKVLYIQGGAGFLCYQCLQQHAISIFRAPTCTRFFCKKLRKIWPFFIFHQSRFQLTFGGPCRVKSL